MLCVRWEATDETVQKSYQTISCVGICGHCHPADTDRIICIYRRRKRGADVLLYPGEFPQIPGSYVYERYFKSFKLGILTTVICLGLGYPLAYIISKCPEKSQSLLILLVTIPEWINMLLRTYAWMNLLSDNGIINHLLGLLGISPVTMMYTDFSVVVGLVCNFMPFMIIPIHTSLSKMDKSFIEAAYDLGANKFQTFTKVIWKLSIPGVLNGIMMVFLLSISTFVIPKLLGGGQYMLIGNLIESQFISVGDWNFGSAISLILAVLILIFMSLMKKMDKDE